MWTVLTTRHYLDPTPPLPPCSAYDPRAALEDVPTGKVYYVSVEILHLEVAYGCFSIRFMCDEVVGLADETCIIDECCCRNVN